MNVACKGHIHKQKGGDSMRKVINTILGGVGKKGEPEVDRFIDNLKGITHEDYCNNPRIKKRIDSLQHSPMCCYSLRAKKHIVDIIFGKTEVPLKEER